MKIEIETTSRKYWDKTWSRLLKHQGMIAPSGKLIQLMLPYINRGEAVLDLGCGEGRNTIYLSRIGYRAFGLDLSPKGVQVLANNLFEEEVKAFGLIGDARHIPFRSASFSGILAHNLFDHLDEKGFRLAFNEAFRLLKPFGVLLMTIDALPSSLNDKQAVPRDDGSMVFIAGPHKGMLIRPFNEKQFGQLIENGWALLKEELSPRQSRILLLQKGNHRG